jgi:hypothetical protein
MSGAPGPGSLGGAFARRKVLVVLLLGSLSLGAKTNTDNYLDSSLLLVTEATREGEFLRRRLYDRKLSELVRRIAEGRLAAAQSLFVPQEVALAHPHLLLMLEHYERAAAAAAAGDVPRSVHLLRDAEDEEQLFRGILRQLGFPLTPEK